MNEILPINPDKMNNDSHFSYHVGMLSRLLANRRVKSLTSAFVPVYREALLVESELLLILRNCLRSDNPILAYMRRDACYLKLMNTLETFPSPSDPASLQACLILREFITANRIPPGIQPEQETEFLRDFVSRLYLEYGAEVSKLSLGDMVSELKGANEQVRKLICDRHWEGSIRRIDLLKDTRLQVDDTYFHIVERINVCARLGSDAECGAFICQINARIVRSE